MQLPSSDRKKIVTQGIGSYVFMYLFMWIYLILLLTQEVEQLEFHRQSLNYVKGGF